MKNEKFIIHNHTKNYNDCEIFKFIFECLEKGLLSNKETEYCYCTVRQFEKIELVCTFNKTKNNYRIDVYEENKE